MNNPLVVALNGANGESMMIVRDALCQSPLDDRYMVSMEGKAGMISRVSKVEELDSRPLEMSN